MKIKRLFAILLCIALVCVTAVVAFGEDPPEGFSSWEEYYDFLIYGETGSTEVPELHDMNKVAENDRFTMYYYENGADVFLEEKATGKVWGSAVDSEYLDTSSMAAEHSSNLLTVTYADKDSNLSELHFTDANNDDFSSSVSFESDSVILEVSVTEAEIDFTVELSLTEKGLKLNIPFDSVKENGDHTLVSVKVLPTFGAAKPGEKGYIFYPDGSGALINIADYEMSEPAFYQYTYYCEDEKKFSDFDDRESQDIKNLMLPVFGIKHTKGGVFADIVSGDANAKLHISIDKLYKSYFEFVYRTYETVVYAYSKDTQGVNKVGSAIMKGDRTAEYSILTEKENTYSDMAVMYREDLLSRGELTEKTPSKEIPLSVELFMGISKSGIFGDSVQTLTSFSDAEKITADLYKNGIKNLDIRLLGWSKGGYTTLPTASRAEGKLGGQSALNSLAKFVKNKGGNTYLHTDLINANIKKGEFNTQKHTLRDGLDSPVTDKGEIRYWLNPAIYMNSALAKLQKAQKSNSAISFAAVGSWLLSDSGESRPVSRAEIIAAEIKALKNAAKAAGTVAVSGGNGYVLSSADRLYDIPDNDSGYFQNDVTVPFYQMVVHSFVDYTSLAANMSYDYNYQKLRFVETGSIPHFIITENSPNLLQGTGYSGIFSSEYSMWKDIITEMYNEMNQRLGSVWGLTMDSHTYLTEDVVKVTYSDGSSVYINYGNAETTAEGVTIPAEDYTLKKGANVQ